jgi:putative aldouronate transport system substrate-binding protein
MITRKELLFLLGTIGAVSGGIALAPTKPRSSKRSEPLVDWGPVVDHPEKRLTLSWCSNPAFPSGHSGTWIQRRVEEAFALNLKPVFLDWTSYSNRRPLMLSGGDVPDVNWDGDPIPMRANIQQGFVLEIPYEVILSHAPTYVRYLNQYGPEAWLYSFEQGKNYGIPTFAADDIYPGAPLWRMDWLRNVGIARPPETLEEMHTALYKFRHEDPDRNGEKDTYGFCPDLHWSLSFIEIFAVYGLLPGDFILRDGKIVWGGVQPEAKEVLALLRQWYKEELIDPDFAIGTGGTSPTESKFNNGRTGYTCTYGAFPDFDLRNSNSRYSTMRSLDPKVELAAGKALLGRDGKRRARVWGGPAHVIWFGTQVARQPEKVLRVLRLFETLAQNHEQFLEARLGQRGVHWEWSPERGVYWLPPYDERGEAERNLLTSDIENAYGFFAPCAVPLEFTRSLLQAGDTQFREEHRNPAWGLRNALGKSDVVPSAARYLEDLRLLQSTTFVQIIRGDVPLDAFDTFVTLWKERGGNVLTQEANAMYRQRGEIYRRVGVPTEGRSA